VLRLATQVDDVIALVDEDLVVELTKGICRIPSPLGEERPLAEFVNSSGSVSRSSCKR